MFNDDSQKVLDKYPKMSNTAINITSPENMTYTTPMSGYYPGTFSFEDVPNGAQSPYWIGGVDGEIFAEVGNHKKVYGLIDNSGSTGGDVRHEWASAQDHGVVESWMRFTSTTEGCSFYLRESGTIVGTLTVSGGNFIYIDNTGTYAISGAPTPQINTWYHIRFDFRGSYGSTYQGLTSQYTYRIYINGVAYGPYNFAAITDPSHFRVHTSIEASGITVYWDAVGYSWDTDYNIGDNLNEGLLLSFDTGFTPDWTGYSLDGQINRTISGNTTFSYPIAEGRHNIQLFGNNSLGEIFESDIRYFTIKYFPINIITPENITYTEPMRGYYPATYGFENDAVGTFPDGWETYKINGHAKIISEKGVHKKVLELYDNVTQSMETTKIYNDLGYRDSGTVELWIQQDNLEHSDNRGQLSAKGNNNTIFWLRTIGGINPRWQVLDGGSFVDISGAPTPSIDTWYHIRIDFEHTTGGYHGLGENEYYIYIDGNRYGSYNFGANEQVEELYLHTYSWGGFYHIYFDAVSYSWDPIYNIGDNLKEGLLLSFTNSIVLDWIGYSLNNQPNKSIIGDTVIPLSGNGVHSIRLYGTNSSDFIFESPVRYFTINIPPPQILINSPQSYEYFGFNAPHFDISITTPILDVTWYTLDNGTTIIISNVFLGTIDQSEWEKFEQGLVTIRFYVNDTFGRESFSEVTIYKDLNTPIPPLYNFLIFLILISVGITIVNLIVIRKVRRKKHASEIVIRREEIVTNQQLVRCPYCQKKLNAIHVFCIHCGSKLKY